jgi:hypothetical protein
MGIEVDITIDDKATESMSALLKALSKENRSDLMRVAGQASLVSMQEYYGEFNAKGGWINPSGPTHGPGRKSSGFGNKVTEGWNVSGADANGFTLNNGAPWLNHKITGGTIRPKSGKFLTIPLVPEAHGVRARDYPGKTFFAGRAIMETLPSGEARPVYALVKSVTQKPVKGALSPEPVYLDPALEAIQDQLERALGI